MVWILFVGVFRKWLLPGLAEIIFLFSYVILAGVYIKFFTERLLKRDAITIKHPVIAKYQDQVKDSLRNPDEIRRSNEDPRVHLYYFDIGNVYVCAVCDHLNEKSGYIITAYLTKRIKEGEKIHVKN